LREVLIDGLRFKLGFTHSTGGGAQVRKPFFLLLVAIFAQTALAEQAALTWTTTSGKTIKGMIIKVKKDSITIGHHGGKSANVKEADLVSADRERVAEWRQANTPPESFGTPQKTVVIKTVPLKMLYDVTNFTVAPGARVQLVIANEDEMQHNFVLCRKASKDGMDVASAAIELAEKGMEMNWVPDHKHVLAATKLIDPATQHSLFFTAPKDKGDYPYVCSVPGHAMLMRGVMTVGQESSLRALSYKVYKGEQWNKLPDFSKLTPSSEGEVANNLIDLKLGKTKNDYGMVFEGDLLVPTKAKYTFTLSSDDGSRLQIGDKLVVDNDGIHANKSVDGKIDLEAGTHRLRVEWFDKSGQTDLALSWSGGGIKNQALSVDAPQKGGGKAPPRSIMLQPPANEAIIYRNFIEGLSSRAIAVGYPEGVHLAFDASTMHIALLWRGDFMDAGRHWNGRGQGNQPPAGDDVIKLPQFHQFGTLADDKAQWPDAPSRAANEINKSELHFKGYSLDKRRFPTFMYQFQNARIEDFPAPIDADGSGFTRKISVKGAGDKVYFRPAWGSIEETDRGYLIDSKVYVRVDGIDVKQRPHGKTQELLAAIPAGDSSFTLTYEFPEGE
jgi:azurin